MNICVEFSRENEIIVYFSRGKKSVFNNFTNHFVKKVSHFGDSVFLRI